MEGLLGFNLTHSLGVVLFGAAYLYLGLVEPETFGLSLLLQSVAVVVSAIYLVVSYHFFFWKPLVGATIGSVAFLLATGLAYF